jgi:tight adherence protein C
MNAVMLNYSAYILTGLSCGLIVYFFAERFMRIFTKHEVKDPFEEDYKTNSFLPLISPGANFLKSHEKKYSLIRKKAAEYNQQILEAGGFWGGLDGYDVLSAQLTFAVLVPFILFLTGAVFILGLPLFLLCAIILGIIAFTYPSATLKSQAEKRQNQFLQQLPQALDILRVAAEAGLDFHSSAKYLLDIYIPGAVKEEIAIFQKDLMLGRSTIEALTGIAERMNMPEVTNVFMALAQSIEMGTSTSAMLTTTAQEMRRKRILAAEAEAQKAVVKITFPLLLLILPGVFIVLLGPVIKSLLASYNAM